MFSAGKREPMARLLLKLGLGLLIAIGTWPSWVSADDAPPPPPLPTPLEDLFLPLKEKISTLPSFLGDTDVKLHFRSYYFNRTNPDDTVSEAWAFGGWLGYRSGWLLDTFSMGATFYGSAPLYAPEDREGTLLLAPGQKGYYVPGEAWGALRYKDYALFTGYRQRVDQTYINSRDNRMTPNTFEAVTLGGKVGFAEYLAGYLWTIKQRNSDTFVSMATAAGVQGKHEGVALAGVQLTPIKKLQIDLSNQYGMNVFSTLFAQVDYLLELSWDWRLRLGAQFTDQRAVGDAFLTNAAEKYWAVQVGGTRVQLIWRDLTLTAAFSITGTGNTVQTPWGSYPGYLSMIDQDFDQAGEKAYTVGAAYDFSRTLLQGLSADLRLAWGIDVKNPKTGAKGPNQAEYDTTIDYRPSLQQPFFLKG